MKKVLNSQILQAGKPDKTTQLLTDIAPVEKEESEGRAAEPLDRAMDRTVREGVIPVVWNGLFPGGLGNS